MISLIVAMVLAVPLSPTTSQSAEIQKVEKRLMAPCCYTQSIADHGSDIALQMRKEVTEMVANGESEDQIVGHYRSLYGDRILIVPDGLTGKILFGMPVAISIIACLLLFLCLRQMLRSGRQIRESQGQPSPSGARSDQIEREVGDWL